MKTHYSKNFVIIATILFTTSIAISCREEIIPQNDLVGQRNYPITSNFADIYELAVDAENFFITIKDSLAFYTPIDFLELEIRDYSSGSVFVKVSAPNGKLLFEDLLTNNINYNYNTFENTVPNQVELYFNNYSGKFKLKLIPR